MKNRSALVLIASVFLLFSCAEVDSDQGENIKDSISVDGDTDADTDGDSDSDGDTDTSPDECVDSSECDGKPCVDGYCCDSACDSLCEACDVLGFEGVCTKIPDGVDPDDECEETPKNDCGTTGACDGAGSCKIYAADSPCDDQELCTTEDLCDGEGNCVGQVPMDCDPGPANECCVGDCDSVDGCYTEVGDCEETCSADELFIGLTCQGCGGANAEGSCVGGAIHICAEDNLCEQLECNAEAWYCTNIGGIYQWSTDFECDDEDDCTFSDACLSGTCVGTGYSCNTDDCMIRECDGQGTCDETPQNEGSFCETDAPLACPADYCRDDGDTLGWFNFPDTCTKTCELGTCVDCICETAPVECAVSGCCDKACADETGCYAVPGSCGLEADVCDNKNELQVLSVCGNCELNGDDGNCAGGGTFVCDEDTHEQCEAVTCNDVLYYCNQVDGVWEFREDDTCDDANVCTENDMCGEGGSCSGTNVVCPSGGCCEPLCNAVDGCATEPGDCPDICETVELYVSQTCSGCAEMGATGTCGGTPTVCDAGALCQQVSCDNVLYYCTNVGGLYEWRIGNSCNDGEDCTYGDYCDASGTCNHLGDLTDVCVSSDPCINRACDGDSTCSESYTYDSCDDAESCTFNDVCDGAGGCAGIDTTASCTVTYCNVQECDGDNGCLDNFSSNGTFCGTSTCGLDYCDGSGVTLSWNNLSSDCDKGCDDDGNCDDCVCEPAVESCDPPITNECCEPVCDAVTGCDSTVGTCLDTCGEGTSLTIGQNCVGCDGGGILADGTCIGGAVHDCTSENLCQKLECNGMNYYCTNEEGSFAWRMSFDCDDGIACTYADSCSDGTCVGTGYSCADTDCATRECDGDGGCTDAPINEGMDCDVGNPMDCQGDECTGSGTAQIWWDYPDNCTKTCQSGTCGDCTATQCTPSMNSCSAYGCCEESCSDDLGCYAVPGSCGAASDVCDDPNVKIPFSSCEVCEEDGDDGSCIGGGTFTCNASSHLLCQTVTCDDVLYYCSEIAGVWEWRPSDVCDDGDACTVSDVCAGIGNCSGIADTCTAGGCCEAGCDVSTGCETTPGVCNDICTTTILDVNQSCVGCGASAATGACEGDSYTCNDTNLCKQVTCDGTAYSCTNVGGVYEWRLGNSCDDGDDCTYGDYCNAATETCDYVGDNTAVCVSSDPCVVKFCDGDATCGESYTLEPCDDLDSCTNNDTCDGAGTCVGEDSGVVCTTTYCNAQDCDGLGGCIDNFSDIGDWCGETTCNPDYCSGSGDTLAHNDNPDVCEWICDGAGNCSDSCTCSDTVVDECDVGVTDECCDPTCSEAVGCATENGVCDDVCETNTLTVGDSCSGCGATDANGVCSGGVEYNCSTSSSDGACTSEVCGVATQYCNGGADGLSWEWRTDENPICGDGCCNGTEDICCEDCGVHCGNDVCDCGETIEDCAVDCDTAVITSFSGTNGTNMYLTDVWDNKVCSGSRSITVPADVVPNMDGIRVTIDAYSTAIGNFRFSLVTPHGSFDLTKKSGSNNLFNSGTKFTGTSDLWWTATGSIAATADDPASGTYTPNGLASWENLYDQAGEGTWTLNVVNEFCVSTGKTLTLDYWTLELEQGTP